MVIDFSSIKFVLSKLKLDKSKFSISSLLFTYVIILFTFTLLVSGLITYFILKNIELNKFEKQLKSTVVWVDYFVDHSSNKKKKLSLLVKDLAKQLDLRVTLANNHGTIVADSKADIINMKNIYKTQEFTSAIRGNIGVAHTYSELFSKYYLHTTKRIHINSKLYVVKISMPTEQIFETFLDIWIAITLVFAITFYIALLFLFNIGNQLSIEIDKILDFLVKLVNKDYSVKYTPSFTKEFSLISNKITKISESSKMIEEERDKYTSKLKHLSTQQGDILSAISHEFKNPIAAIVGYSQTLLEDIAIDKKIRVKFLKKIVTNSNKLTNLIDKLSLSFRFEKGDLDINFEQIDITKIVDESTNDLLQKHLHRTINLHFEVKPIYIKADKTFMQSVIINLIDNALKYSEDDIDVYVNTKSVIVKDYGIGIEDKDIHNITKRFYRASKKSWDNSMGVGLFLVDSILKAHETDLEIKSEYTKGSTFSFSIEDRFMEDDITENKKEELI